MSPLGQSQLQDHGICLIRYCGSFAPCLCSSETPEDNRKENNSLELYLCSAINTIYHSINDRADKPIDLLSFKGFYN